MSEVSYTARSQVKRLIIIELSLAIPDLFEHQDCLHFSDSVYFLETSAFEHHEGDPTETFQLDTSPRGSPKVFVDFLFSHVMVTQKRSKSGDVCPSVATELKVSILLPQLNVFWDLQGQTRRCDQLQLTWRQWGSQSLEVSWVASFTPNRLTWSFICKAV